MSEHQDTIAAAMNRRIQDSAIRAARLIAQHNEERQHTEELQAEYNSYMNLTRAHQIHSTTSHTHPHG